MINETKSEWKILFLQQVRNLQGNKRNIKTFLRLKIEYRFYSAYIHRIIFAKFFIVLCLNPTTFLN